MNNQKPFTSPKPMAKNRKPYSHEDWHEKKGATQVQQDVLLNFGL
jgi:hypothetical protein